LCLAVLDPPSVVHDNIRGAAYFDSTLQ